MNSKVIFKVDFKGEAGESIYLLGNSEELKVWDTTKAIKLKLIEQNIWASPEIIISEVIEYKFFKKNLKGDIVWEWDTNKPNRILQLSSGLSVEVIHTFGISHEEIIIKKKGKYSEYDCSRNCEISNLIVISLIIKY